MNPDHHSKRARKTRARHPVPQAFVAYFARNHTLQVDESDPAFRTFCARTDPPHR